MMAKGYACPTFDQNPPQPSSKGPQMVNHQKVKFSRDLNTLAFCNHCFSDLQRLTCLCFEVIALREITKIMESRAQSGNKSMAYVYLIHITIDVLGKKTLRIFLGKVCNR